MKRVFFSVSSSLQGQSKQSNLNFEYCRCVFCGVFLRLHAHHSPLYLTVNVCRDGTVPRFFSYVSYLKMWTVTKGSLKAWFFFEITHRESLCIARTLKKNHIKSYHIHKISNTVLNTTKKQKDIHDTESEYVQQEVTVCSSGRKKQICKIKCGRISPLNIFLGSYIKGAIHWEEEESITEIKRIFNKINE